MSNSSGKPRAETTALELSTSLIDELTGLVGAEALRGVVEAALHARLPALRGDAMERNAPAQTREAPQDRASMERRAIRARLRRIGIETVPGALEVDTDDDLLCDIPIVAFFYPEH